MSPGVQLWLAFESQLDDPETLQRCAALMSEEERERDRKFLVDGARRLHVLARALQRTVLASCMPGIAPDELRFTRGVSGRPSLAPPFDASGVEFNLAHTRGLVALAVARGMRLGVDVEWLQKKVPLAAARRYFSSAEVQALDALPEEARPRHFLRLWTLKESYLKAIGTGIAGGLGSMTFHLDETVRWEFERAEDPNAGRWWFGQFEVGKTHLLAVACLPETRPPLIEWHEYAAAGARPAGISFQRIC
jgi:4'-phosphopantetheinyl transferase